MTKSYQARSKFKFINCFAATLAFSTFLATATSPVKATLEDSPKQLVDEVWQIVNHEFVDRKFNQVDWANERSLLLGKNYTSSQAAYTEIRKSLRELGDPYTRFLNPEEFSELTSQTSGELSGIGVRLAIEQSTKELVVVEPLANSPADQAGIEKGDRILTINGKPTSLMTLEQASQQIKGKVGTDIKLTVAREGVKAFELTITRAQIELPSVDYTLSKSGQTNVGYIKLDEFSSHAAEQMQKAIQDLHSKKVNGFVLDLRGNPGGLLFSSVEIARMWLKEGAIVSTVDRKGGNQKFSANGKSLTDLPLVILIDRFSASASEILAGALKENGRATLVGTRTYGKGTVQSVHSLSDGSGVAVTIAQYFPPSGIDINTKGIQPDIKVDLTEEEQLNLSVNPSLLGTQEDPQYARAIQILQNSQSGNDKK